MNGLIKRMCILKQLKAGFSTDGNPLSGVVRVERYGKLSTVQLSLINFAPLSDGRYVCVLCDKQGERLIFPLSARTGEFKESDSPFDPEKGFCAAVCFLRSNNAECIAAGQYGGGAYNLRFLLDGLTMPEKTVQKEEEKKENCPPMPEREVVFIKPQKYDDEAVSENNYYAEESKREKGNSAEDIKDENAFAESEEKTSDGSGFAKNDQTEKLFRPFKIADGQSYYYSIKDELERLLSTCPRVNDLTAALPDSEWVRVEDAGGCLVGVIYENLQVRYIAYALPAHGNVPPEGLENACFIPVNPLSEFSSGYFVLFQDAATGESVQVERG